MFSIKNSGISETHQEISIYLKYHDFELVVYEIWVG
jgi:hypothetical protein